MTDPIDCLIVGGGPAGLTAAIYLARYHLNIRVIDGGDSRAEWIPLSHNHAGYPDGISGRDLIDRMRRQAERYGVALEFGRVEALAHGDRLYTAATTLGEIAARTVLIATGTVNHGPPMSADDHDAALAQGLLRYCPVCDGYEATDRHIAVLGLGDRGAREALFLRGFSPRVTLVDIEGDPGLATTRRDELRDAAIDTIPGPATEVRIDGNRIVIETPSGPHAFDTLYPALGSTVRSELAVGLGALRAEDGSLAVDSHCRAGIAGLYAAGDVVAGLDQISNAMGQAAVAATTIRNDLARDRPIRR